MRNETFGARSCAAMADAARANAQVVVGDPHTGILTFEIGTVPASALLLLLFTSVVAHKPTDGTIKSKRRQALAARACRAFYLAVGRSFRSQLPASPSFVRLATT
jgi:hypothetical protein